jgi:hypothetical protein
MAKTSFADFARPGVGADGAEFLRLSLVGDHQGFDLAIKRRGRQKA